MDILVILNIDICKALEGLKESFSLFLFHSELNCQRGKTSGRNMKLCLILVAILVHFCCFDTSGAAGYGSIPPYNQYKPPKNRP